METMLFTTDMLSLEENKRKKQNYVMKRYIYDKLSSVVEELIKDEVTKNKIMKELKSILMMKNNVKETPQMQKIITIGEFKKSEGDLIAEFVKLYNNDPTILNRLGEKIM
jgi:hypothetical protein